MGVQIALLCNTKYKYHEFVAPWGDYFRCHIQSLIAIFIHIHLFARYIQHLKNQQKLTEFYNLLWTKDKKISCKSYQNLKSEN